MKRRGERATETGASNDAPLGAWLSSLRFSGFTVLIIALIAGGAIIISPSLSTYVQQRREIAELTASVEEHRESVEEIDAERARWKDPAYVRSQARDRLFYVMPGETQLNIIDDVAMPIESTEETNASLTRMDSNWALGLASSVLTAATTEAPPPGAADAAEAPAPESVPTEEPTP